MPCLSAVRIKAFYSVHESAEFILTPELKVKHQGKKGF